MSDIPERVAELSERARRDREAFEPPTEPPDEEAALQYLTEGAGQVVALYIETRTDEMFRFDDAQFALLERALNDWLELYAACYGTDLEGAYSVREALSEETYIEGESIADVVESENVLLRHNEVQSRVFFVATVHGDVVGWVHIHAPEIEKLRHTAELTVGVIDEYRGHGVGTKLLDRGVDWALDHDFEKLYNSVPATNEDAIQFLEERGWDTEAVREDHYKIGDDYVDEVMMAKGLA